MEQQAQHNPPSAAKMDLNDEQMRVAAKINHIMEARGADGDFRYNNDEVRDFMVACIFELGIPLSLELQVVMRDFIAELEIDVPEPTADDVINGVRAYFDANPLNAELAKKFQELGASELFKSREGFKSDGGHMNRTLASAGINTTRRAPRAAEMKPRAGKLKIKRGLS
jgi:hypothetical protein